MSIRKGIYNLLKATETDVYALAAPQELTDTYAVFSVRIEYVRSQDGVEVKEASLSLNIYANTMAACVTLADSFSAALENASGTYDSESLIVGLFLSESDDYIENLDKYVISQEYLLKFL